MTEANITIDDQGVNGEKTVKIANITGQLDESNVDEKIQVLYQTIEQTPTNLVLILNLENLEYMNSKAIGYITDLYGKITENGGQLIICAARPNIADILQVVGLSQLVKVVDSLNTAKALVGAPQGTQQNTQPSAAAPAPEVTQPASNNAPSETGQDQPSAPQPEATNQAAPQATPDTSVEISSVNPAAPAPSAEPTQPTEQSTETPAAPAPAETPATPTPASTDATTPPTSAPQPTENTQQAATTPVTPAQGATEQSVTPTPPAPTPEPPQSPQNGEQPSANDTYKLE